MGCCQCQHKHHHENETLIVRVIKAEMYKSFDDTGDDDLFVLVERVQSDGTCLRVGRTRTAWDAGLTPVWNYMCLGFKPPVKSSSECLRFRLYDDDEHSASSFRLGEPGSPGRRSISMATHCGDATLTMYESLQRAKERNEFEVELLNNGEKVGTLTLLFECSKAAWPVELTIVPPTLFRQPVKRIGVSGGTAPFFCLELASDGNKMWIGKDLSRATNEIVFYEESKILQEKNAPDLGPLHSAMMPYLGVVDLPIKEGPTETLDIKLLVLRNLFYGRKHLRMLDIKIGEVTAQAGWQGKSWFAATKQSLLDALTNSAKQGFRLEGFDGAPEAFETFDPMVDVHDFTGTLFKSEKARKKARRMMLQSMSADEMLVSLLDTHQCPPDPGDSNLGSTISPSELAEQVLASLCRKVVGLAIGCRQVLAPQKWIGSSVALGFDDGALPAREAHNEVPDRGIVYIFDWGRSELNTIKKHNALSKDEQEDRVHFWNLYKRGIDVLSRELALHYESRFSHVDGWMHVCVEVHDLDSFKKPDLLGDVNVPLIPIEKAVLDLSGSKGAKLTYSVFPYRVYPENSRFQGAWRIHLHSCTGLSPSPRSPDSFAKVIGVPLSGKKDEGFVQYTHCIQNCVDPIWDEFFEFSVPRKTGQLLQTFTAAGIEFNASDLSSSNLRSEQQWAACIDAIASRKSLSVDDQPFKTDVHV